jgi:ABC-type xylose transport system permease subunit
VIDRTQGHLCLAISHNHSRFCAQPKLSFMRYFAIGIDGLFIRFILMMACVIIGGFIGQFWIAGFALPIFLSAMLGISFRRGSTTESKNMNTTGSDAKKAA